MLRPFLVQITRLRLSRGVVALCPRYLPDILPFFQDFMLRFVTCPPLPLTYTMSITIEVWGLEYEGYSSRHGDYPGIHGRNRVAVTVRKGMGDLTSRLPRSTPWRRLLSPDSPVRREKLVNSNTKPAWPKSQGLAKVCLRPPTPGYGQFTLA